MPLPPYDPSYADYMQPQGMDPSTGLAAAPMTQPQPTPAAPQAGMAQLPAAGDYAAQVRAAQQRLAIMQPAPMDAEPVPIGSNAPVSLPAGAPVQPSPQPAGFFDAANQVAGEQDKAAANTAGIDPALLASMTPDQRANVEAGGLLALMPPPASPAPTSPSRNLYLHGKPTTAPAGARGVAPAGPSGGAGGGSSLQQAMSAAAHPYGAGPVGDKTAQLVSDMQANGANQASFNEGMRSQQDLDAEALAKAGEDVKAKTAERTRDFQDWQAKRQEIDDAAADFKIDPDRYMRNKSIFSKVLLTFAAGLQGAAQGLRGEGGPNPVVQNVREDIKQDVELQKEDYERLLKKGQNADNLYGMMMRETQNEDAATALANEYATKAAAGRLAATAGRVNDSQVQGAAKEHVDQLQLSIAQDQAKAQAAAASAAAAARKEYQAKLATAIGAVRKERPDITDPAQVEREAHLRVEGVDLGHGAFQAPAPKGEANPATDEKADQEDFSELSRLQGEINAAGGPAGAGIGSAFGGHVKALVQQYNDKIDEITARKAQIKPGAAAGMNAGIKLDTGGGPAQWSGETARKFQDAHRVLRGLHPVKGKAGDGGEGEGGG